MNSCKLKHDIEKPGKGLIKEVVKELNTTYQDETGVNHIEGSNLPSKNEIIAILTQLEEVIFPGFANRKIIDFDNVQYFVGNLISEIYIELTAQAKQAFLFQCKKDSSKCKECDADQKARNAAMHLIKNLPKIRKTVKTDVIAAFDGDPAAKSLEEIILSYPGIYAIIVHRIAHELYKKKVPLIPRIMSEYAHSKVGIDIHPGAKIGDSFFIDHGTGVVIGETAILGTGIKIYQGVTLGALSFPKDEKGNIIRNKKRHPTLEDNVTVYSGATVLGDVTLGKGSLIGGNVWLTKTIEPNTIVTMSEPELRIKTKQNKK
jgi:serine O-acetyltransferase